MEKHYNILLAEDSPEDAHLTQIAFEQTGILHKLHLVKDGEECLSYLNPNGSGGDFAKPDLILLDLNMPKKDGKSVLKEIKSNEALMDIPTIVLSTSEAPEDIHACYELKANCVLSKPLSFKQFRELIDRVTTFWLKSI